MRAPGGDAIRRRDEILQVMYWMRGEGLRDAVGPEDLARFLQDGDAATLCGDLEVLTRAELAEQTAEGRFRLTDRGVAEGGRRFAEAFDGLTGPGHGACSDPQCDCHELGPEACTHTHTN